MGCLYHRNKFSDFGFLKKTLFWLLKAAYQESNWRGKMAKIRIIDPNKPLTRLELDIVYLRYYEGLHSSEIAEQLGIELEKVKDKFKKPNVSRYIQRVVLPSRR
jgi:hypothetical protein